MKHRVEVNINVCFQFLEIEGIEEEEAIESAAAQAEAILKTDLIVPWRNSPNKNIHIQMAESEAEIME